MMLWLLHQEHQHRQGNQKADPVGQEGSSKAKAIGEPAANGLNQGSCECRRAILTFHQPKRSHRRTQLQHKGLPHGEYQTAQDPATSAVPAVARCFRSPGTFFIPGPTPAFSRTEKAIPYTIGFPHR